MYNRQNRFVVRAGMTFVTICSVLVCLLPCSAEVTLVGVPEGTPTYYKLSGTGTYANAINTSGLKLQVDATKIATGTFCNMTLTGGITASEYRQVDGEINSSNAGGQSGIVTLNGGMTANFSGNFTTGGHTTTNIGTTDSTATVTVTGLTTIGNSMTSTLNIASGSTFNAQGGFYQNTIGAQGHVNVNGTLNLNSTEDGSLRLGNTSNSDYTSVLTINNGGVLNALNTTAHCGYDGQLYFKLNSGGTANFYGITFAHNNDSGSRASVGKTLQLLGGTLNLGAGGISIRSGKVSYPFQLKSGTISTLEGTTATTIKDVVLGIGSGTVQFAPKAGATMTVSSTIENSTWADAGTGGQVQMTGAGTLDIAGSFNTTGGLKAVSGKTIISGNFAGGQLLTGGGAIEITGTVSGGTQTFSTGTVNVTSTAEITGGTMNVSGDAVVSIAGTLTDGALNVSGGTATMTSTNSAAPYQITVQNGGNLTLAYIGAINTNSKAPISVEAGGTLTLSMPETNTSNIQYWNPITLNGGMLTSNKVGTSDSRFRNVHAPITLTADSEIKAVSNRIEVRANIVGNGHILTISGNDVIFDQVGRGANTGLKKIVSTAGMLCLQSNAQRALVTTEGTYLNAGKLQLWSLTGVEGNVFFNGASFESNGSGSSSTAKSAVFTLQKNTNFSTSTYGTSTPTFTMNGKLVAASGITLNKTGTRPMILAGNLSEFHGNLQSSAAQVNFQNGGNTEATAYDFTTKLNGGTASITDSGTYFFKDGTEIVNFASASNPIFSLGSGTIRSLGTTSTISSSVAGAKITATTGTLDLGTAGNTLNFTVSSGDLTVDSLTTSGGTFTKSGSGTLTVGTLNVTDGNLLVTSAMANTVQTLKVDSTASIQFAPEAEISALELDLKGKISLNVTNEMNGPKVHSQVLNSITVDPNAIIELTTTETQPLDLDSLFENSNSVLLVETTLAQDLSAISLPVAFDPNFFKYDSGLQLMAIGDAFGNISMLQVPEPSTWLLFLAGVVGFLPLRRIFSSHKN